MYLVNVWGCSSAGRAPALQAGGQEFDSPHLHHHVAASVISLAATFLQKSPCAHSAAAPLSRKILRFFTSLRLRRFFILKPLWLARFVYTKYGFTLSAAAPFSQKTYRFFGSCAYGAFILKPNQNKSRPVRLGRRGKRNRAGDSPNYQF